MPKSGEETRLYKLYKKAKDFDSGRFEDYKELVAYYEGDEAKLKKGSSQPWVVHINSPYASNAIDKRVASLMANDYIGELQPLSLEDVERVRSMQMLYENYWKRMKLDNKVNEAIFKCAVAREAYIHIVYDADEIVGGRGMMEQGKLEGYFLEPGSVLIDPQALSLKQADYVVITERLTKNEVKTRYPKLGDDDKEIFSPEDRGETYVNRDYSTDQENVSTKLTYYERKGDTIKKTITVDGKVAEKSKELPIKIFPIAQLRWEKRAASPYGISLMDRLLPLQKAIGSIESAITNTALSFAAPSFVVRKDSGLNPKQVAQAAGAPGAVYPVNGDPKTAITPLLQPKIDQQILEIKREYEMTVDKVSHITDQFEGDIGTAGNTSGGAEQAVNRSKIIEYKFLRNMEEFVEDLTEIIVEYLTKAFQGRTLYARDRQKSTGEFNFQSVQVDEQMAETEFTYSIDLSVKTQFALNKEKQLMMELFQIENQYDVPVKTLQMPDLINKFDLTNKYELSHRYKQLAQQDKQQKAQLVMKLTALSNKYQLPQELLSQAIVEIMEGKDTPTVEALMQEAEKAAQKQAMQQEQMDSKLMEIEQEEQEEMNETARTLGL